MAKNGQPQAQPAPTKAPARSPSELLLAEACALLKGIVAEDGKLTPTTPANLIEHLKILKANYERAVTERAELSRAWRSLGKTLG